MRRWRPWLVGLAGLALVVAGTVVFWIAERQPFGWVMYGGSYSPLDPREPAPYTSSLGLSFGGPSVLWTGRHLLGAGLTVLGLLLLVGLGGWLLGRRASRELLPTSG